MTVRVFQTLDEARNQFGPAAVAIGNFDGVHIGHRALIAAMSQHADTHNLNRTALTFHPHPAVLVAPDRVPPMLCTLQDRIRHLAEMGVERILVLPFTPELSRFSPEQFVTRVLLETLETKAVFVGENFHFGYRQAGTPEVLANLGRQYCFETTFLKPVEYRGAIVSSTAIRKALQQHRLTYASRMLGRCFYVSNDVVPGKGIGHRQTVPTLNILPAPEQLLLRGVFITRTFDLNSEQSWPSITNVGVRPTFQGEGVTIESYLLSPLESEPPKTISVEFRRFVRDEKAFENPEALKQQIFKDVARAQSYWRRVQHLR